ncbi:hypothetical protein ALC60_14429 [Trachymyrmex zeteki]|uniref:Uncharacterized protein n=1 Tax=Mycetomoellerius zeteki TaxID=64791 RepID=A0A151WFF7_9HYME|nr:hypothetical protein ALC60_14429 [Trachymyrmex zeteki]
MLFYFLGQEKEVHLANLLTDVEAEDYILWLQNNSEPFTTVQEYWSKTVVQRKAVNNGTIHEYFNKFPCLKLPLEYTLLEQDFDFHYSDKKNCLLSKWSQIATALLKLAENKTDSYLKELVKEYKEQFPNNNPEDKIFALSILPLFFPCSYLKCKRAGTNRWRPSKIEMRKGFLLHVKIAGDLQRELQTRRDKLASFHLTAQPLPIIVGSNINTIESCYVSVNDILYKVDTPLRAIDLCFKIFHVMNASYPPEAETAWTFIEQLVVHESLLNPNNSNKNSKQDNKIEFQTNSQIPMQLNTNNLQEVPSLLETLTTFHDSLSSNHNSSIILFIANLYNNSLIPRSFVQEVVNSLKNIFCSGVICDIKQVVSNRLQSLNEDLDIINTVTSMFETLENSFNHVDTEYKRLQYFKSSGQYIPPRSFVIGQRTIEKRINGQLWKSQVSYFGNKTVFPMFIYFDDYETGNALGSHSGKNKLGAVYFSLPSIPQELKSSLTNIYLFALFKSEDRKTFGNAAVFGMHTLLGLTESFSSNFRCRFCKIKKVDSYYMYIEDETLLRTHENYEHIISKTGIKEPCIWHQLNNFHLTRNYCVDMMHDLFEGACNYSLMCLLHNLIFVLKLFSLHTLNERIKCFGYNDTEISNKPPPITSDNLKERIRMSASEMLCFFRYLGVMIGDLIPVNLPIWEVWLLKMSGPLVHLWSMRSEQKHRESKMISNVSCNFKNIAYTLAVKAQLKLCHQLLSNSASNMVFGEIEPLNFDLYIKYFSNLDSGKLHQVKWINVNGTKYIFDTILALDCSENMLLFGAIKYIVLFSEVEIYFICNILRSTAFDRHVHAYEIVCSTINETDFLIVKKYSELHDYGPCLLTKTSNKYLICTRWAI